MPLACLPECREGVVAGGPSCVPLVSTDGCGLVSLAGVGERGVFFFACSGETEDRGLETTPPSPTIGCSTFTDMALGSALSGSVGKTPFTTRPFCPSSWVVDSIVSTARCTKWLTSAGECSSKPASALASAAKSAGSISSSPMLPVPKPEKGTGTPVLLSDLCLLITGCCSSSMYCAGRFADMPRGFAGSSALVGSRLPSSSWIQRRCVMTQHCATFI